MLPIDDDHTRLSGGPDAPTLLSDSEQATMLSPLSQSGGAPDQAHALEDGQVFGPYRIIRLLGRGGMGEVYEAEHLDTSRRVAIKLLRGRIDRREDRERFLREGQLAASISDPHTVYVFGSEEIDGFMATELLDDLDDERDAARQRAFQVYLAGTLKAELLAGDAPWSVGARGNKDAARRATLAGAAAALTPTEAELAEAAALIAPARQRAEERFLQQDDTTTIFLALLLVGSGLSLGAGLVSITMRPSGIMMSSLGLAVVTRSGREVSRIRAMLRLLVAWLPLLVYGALLWWPVTRSAVTSITIASLAAAPTVIGFVWSLIHPARGPHDLIAGTSIGAR